MKTLKLEDSTARLIYPTAPSELKKILEETYGKDFFSQKIQDRVKTWDDVLEILGKDEDAITPYKKPKDKRERSINAFAKIQAISEVLNEGWVPDFNNTSQYKYYPYFQKKSSGWVLCSYGDYRGYSFLGSGCFYRTSDLALYAGKEFEDIYKDYLP